MSNAWARWKGRQEAEVWRVERAGLMIHENNRLLGELRTDTDALEHVTAVLAEVRANLASLRSEA